MKIEKNHISEEKAFRYCLTEILNGNYKYITYIKLDKRDTEEIKAWLSECEKVAQDYFFMYFHTDKKYNNLFGCSSFRIPDLYNSKAEPIAIKKKTDREIKGMLSLWTKYCDYYYISESLFDEVTK